MKKETKELIKWIKLTLDSGMDNYCYDRYPEKEEVDNENYKKAIEFLDGLEDFEKQLKQGGFIPDCNNKPCKHGDKVKIVRPDPDNKHCPIFKTDEMYFLIWDEENYNFCLSKTIDGNYLFFNKDDLFEKVKYEEERLP